MIILHVITRNELGGAQTVVAHLANYLSNEHKVIVAAGEGDGKLFEQLSTSVERVECRWLKRSISPVYDILVLLELVWIYRKYKPDVIHLHSSKAGMLGRIVFPTRKIVYTVHGFDSVRVAHRQLLPLERTMQYFCKKIVGVSKYDLKNLENEGIKHGVTCIYNGIPEPKLEKCPQLNIPDFFKKKVLCIARLSPPKNSALFIKVAEQLPEVAFIWIGNQREVKSNLANVFFMGNIPDAGRYCASTDLFMLPSNYEGLPIVVIEAMSYGLPVVVSNVGGVSEIVEDGVNGFVAENNVDDFLNKINKILWDDSIAQKMARESRRMFVKKLSADRMLDSYLEIYSELYESQHREG